MLNPRHTLTAFQKKMAEKDYDNHKKRLAEIQKPKKNMSEEKDVVMRSTFVDLHSKHVQFQTTEKISSLDKTNKVLLDKLVKISRNQKPALFKSTHWTGHPGTLNTTYRKKELERIALENESMAKRLISQHSSVDHKKLKLDFLKHQEFSKNAQKNTYSSPKLSAKLPPLQSPKLEESPKDLRIKNKVKQRISSESVSPAASKSQTLDKTQQAQPAIRVVDSIPANPNRESNLSLQPQQAQERKEAPTSRSSQPQEAVEASARQSDSRRESQVNENKQQEKQEVVEQGNEISRKTSTKTVGEGENQVQSDKAEEKAEEKAVEVKEKEKEKEKEEEGEKSEKKETVEEKQEVVNESQEVKKKEEESENKEVENKEKQENANA